MSVLLSQLLPKQNVKDYYHHHKDLDTDHHYFYIIKDNQIYLILKWSSITKNASMNNNNDNDVDDYNDYDNNDKEITK